MAQACASAFGIPHEMVKVEPNTTLTAPNSMVTGASIGSDTCSLVIYFNEMLCFKLKIKSGNFASVFGNQHSHAAGARRTGRGGDLAAGGAGSLQEKRKSLLQLHVQPDSRNHNL